MSLTIQTTTVVHFIKGKVKRSYSSLDKALKEWFGSLSEKNVIYIAISRKAPRLLEWCAYRFGNKKLIVISENALPFLDISKFDKAYVIDEAIYHGTTFTRIYDIVSRCNQETIAKPFLITDEAFRINLNFERPYKLDNNDVNFFIDTIISRFHQLGKPYDMEFPILYVQLKKPVAELLPDILDSLRNNEEIRCSGKKIRPWYSTKTIAREDGVETVNYTFITDYLFDNILEKTRRPSFSKLRFHSKGDMLSIMVASPYIINERDLTLNSKLFTGRLLEIWNQIYLAADKTIYQSDELLSVQRRKSLVVMANYLLSLNTFLMLRDSVDKSLGNYAISDLRIDKRDLGYLIGSILADALADEINGCPSEASSPSPTALPVPPSDSYIPYIYEEAYNRKLGADNLADDADLSECVSNQFSAIHWEVEIKSRKNPIQSSERLQFGESYQSLYERYKNHGFNRKALLYDLSKNLDSRIDRGSVVPNYNCFSTLGTNYWVRLFRAGENEDILRDQLFRIIGNILTIYKNANNGDRISYGHLTLLLSLLCYGDKSNRVFATNMSIGYDEESMLYKVYAQYNDGKKVDVIEHCMLYGLLKNDDFGFLVLGDNDSNRFYDTGIPLDIPDEKNIVNQAKFVSINGKSWHDANIYAREMINFLVYDDEEFGQQLSYWTNQVRAVLSQDDTFDYISIRKGLKKLYDRFPDTTFQILLEGNGKPLVHEDIKEVFCQVKMRIIDSKTIINRLSRYIYIAGLWNKEINGADDDWVLTKPYSDHLLNSFDEEHKKYIAKHSSLHGNELRDVLIHSLY